MTTDIFLRSYAGDIAWVPFALRSINKFVTGVRNVIICVPGIDLEKFKALKLTREALYSSRLPSLKDDYLGQQADKLHADQYTGADYILFWDSDVLAIRPFCPMDLTINGKPRCLETPFSKLVNEDGSPATPWKPIVERALGHPVDKERMRQHPMMVHRDALTGLRSYIQKTHNVSLFDYIGAQRNRELSEFNVLHSWAAHHAPDLFTFWDTEERSVPFPFVKQYRSWDGITNEIRDEMEATLI